MDRAYEGDKTRELCQSFGHKPVVPPKKNRINPWEYDHELYKRRNIIERLFRWLKAYRRVCTRYDKLDVIFLSFVQIACVFTRALEALKRQRIQKQKILFKGIETEEQYRDLVFVTKNNRPTQQFIVQEAIGAIVNRIRKEHPDYEMFSPHCLRHTFATRAIENGMQPKTLQKILGHGSLQMTMDLYCHVTEDTLFTEMMKMEKAV